MTKNLFTSPSVEKSSTKLDLRAAAIGGRGTGVDGNENQLTSSKRFVLPLATKENEEISPQDCYQEVAAESTTR